MKLGLLLALLSASSALALKQYTAVDSVAMIFGGLENFNSINAITNSFEYLGCPDGDGGGNYAGAAMPNPMPFKIAGGWGVYWEQEDMLLFCGGQTCANDDSSCSGYTDKCHAYNPRDNTFTEHSTLLRERRNLLMTTIENGDGIVVPLVYGGNGLPMAEIWSPSANAWEEYLELPSAGWVHTGCVAEVQDNIVYTVRGPPSHAVDRLDLTTFASETVWTAPDSFTSPLKCAPLYYQDHWGIMTRYGFWLNLDDGFWTPRQHPPLSYLSEGNPPNAIHSWRSKPTIFGNPVRTPTGETDFEDVVVFNQNPADDADNAWDSVATLNVRRRSHWVIEVPASWCPDLEAATALKK